MKSEKRLLATYTIVFISLPMVISEKYTFYLFENFEMTKDCFIKERHIVKVLQLSRQNLYYKVYQLSRRIYKNHASQSAFIFNTKHNYDRSIEKTSRFKFKLLYDGYHLRKVRFCQIYILHIVRLKAVLISCLFSKVYTNSQHFRS